MAADFLSHFLGRAWANAAAWGYSYDLVSETAGILSNLFGDDWLRKETATPTRATPIPLRRHRIGQALSTPSEDSVIEMIELGRYLAAFKDDPKLPNVVTSLKATYRSAFFQLAMAYRFVRKEYSVSLEPDVERNKVADIQISSTLFRAMAECYVPQPPESMPLQTEIHYLGTQAIDSLKAADHLYSLAIHLVSLPTPSKRKELVARVIEMLGNIEGSPDGHIDGIPGLLTADQECHMSLMRTFETAPGGQSMLVLHPDFPEMDDGDLALFIRAQAGTMADFGLVDKEPKLVSGSHVGIWVDEKPPSPVPSDFVASLVQKVAGKVAQTRLGDSRRIVMVRSADALRLNEAQFGELERLLIPAVQIHPRLDAITFHASGFDRTIHRRPFSHKAVLLDSCDPTSKDVVESLLSWDEGHLVPLRPSK